MTPRLAIALTLFAAAPALAQPAPKTPPPKAAPAAAVDDMAAFEKDLDALFVRGGLTADQAALRAGAASPTVRRKVAEVDAAIAQALQAELQRVPQLRASASYTRYSYIAPVIIPFGGMNFEIPFLQNSYDAQATLVVPLSDYVVRYPKLVDAAHLGEEVARVSKRSAEVSAGEDARLAYYEWVRAKLQVLIAQRQLAQVQATLAQEKAMLDVQRISKADYLRIESQEAQAEQVLDQLANLADLREEQLRLMIGAPDGEKLAVGEDIRAELAVPQIGTLDEMIRRAQERRLDFRVLDVGIAAKDKQRQAERATGYPRLSATATVEDARPNPRFFPQSDTFKTTWVAGLSVSWQLGDTLNAETNTRRLVAETDQLRADRESLYRGTRIEVLSALQAVQLAAHALQTSQKGLAAAEEGYRVRKELLAAERATAVELVDAETDLTRARITALNARVDLRVALAQLGHAIGDDATPVK
ncbi:MAG: TolC family protein [Acidobacteriota bacterium]